MAFVLKSSPVATSPSSSTSLLTGRRFTSQPSSISFRRISASVKAAPARSISDAFSKIRKQGKVALIPFITAGDPDLSTTSEALKILDACGANLIELGIPYSEPVADGPVIRDVHKRALAKGVNFHGVMSMLKEVTPQLSCPVALFTYYNPMVRIGLDKYLSIIQEAGIRGLLIPEVSFEDSESLRTETAKHDIELVLATSPTTPKNRMRSIVNASEGFIYLVSSVGVTGARDSVNSHVQFLIREVKKETDKPVAVGFGISKPEHAKQMASWGADGVIVGTALVKALADAKSPEDGLKALESLAKSFRAALD